MRFRGTPTGTYFSNATMTKTSCHPDFEASRSHRLERLSFAQNIFAAAQRRSVDNSSVSLVEIEGLPSKNDSAPRQHLRRVSAAEVATLEQKECSSNDWSKVFVLIPAGTKISLPAGLVSNTRFDGTVVFILSELSELGTGLPCGVHGCRLIQNCILSTSNVSIYNCSNLEYTFVDEGASIMDCGSLTSSGPCPLTLLVSIGAESGGGRRFRVTPEATLSDLSEQLKNPDDIRLTESHTCRLNIIGAHCIIRHTHQVESVVLHPHTRIDGASLVARTVVLPNGIIEYSNVTNCFLQWDASVSGHSTVSDCLVMEQASVGPSSVVVHSILSPDVHVSTGEVHASLLGPNCNAHHQSLLIGVIWPLGRGNVGYGANVGSNHTGRLPDQECTVGEGVFWGLSCVIKLPVDLSMSPYSIVAAGVQLGPIRCTFPFSLFVTDSTSNKINILPGWVWKSSPYTIVRSEAKFAKRRKAKRHLLDTGWKIVRPDVIELCRKARGVLRQNAHDILAPHIGNCMLTDSAKTSGIHSYTSIIRVFALRGMLHFCRANEGMITLAKSSFVQQLSKELHESSNNETAIDTLCVAWPTFPWDVERTAGATWSYQKWLLLKEFPKDNGIGWEDWIINALDQMLQLEVTFTDRVYKCKRRDDERGARTIPGYKGSHVAAENDPVIQSAQAELKEKEEEITRMIGLLSLSKSKL